MPVGGRWSGRALFAQASGRRPPEAGGRGGQPSTAVTVEPLFAEDARPFIKSSEGGGGPRRRGYDEDFSIHQLLLKAMMKDPKADSPPVGFLRATTIFSAPAAFTRTRSPRNIVAGVSGKMGMAQKTLTLQTAEKDVQVLRLGEEEEKESP